MMGSGNGGIPRDGGYLGCNRVYKLWSLINVSMVKLI